MIPKISLFLAVFLLNVLSVNILGSAYYDSAINCQTPGVMEIEISMESENALELISVGSCNGSDISHTVIGSSNSYGRYKLRGSNKRQRNGADNSVILIHSIMPRSGGICSEQEFFDRARS